MATVTTHTWKKAHRPKQMGWTSAWHKRKTLVVCPDDCNWVAGNGVAMAHADVTVFLLSLRQRHSVSESVPPLQSAFVNCNAMCSRLKRAWEKLWACGQPVPSICIPILGLGVEERRLWDLNTAERDAGDRVRHVHQGGKGISEVLQVG